MWNGEPDGFKQLKKENKEHYKVVFASKNMKLIFIREVWRLGLTVTVLLVSFLLEEMIAMATLKDLSRGFEDSSVQNTVF